MIPYISSKNISESREEVIFLCVDLYVLLLLGLLLGENFI